ncbi:4Fe-4S binding protein [Spirosoma montaniterrae]|uniref:FeS-binding protein n=1 Tax=Spirosoma montaniterrae TaxID=1178516 RepID=A0A1P9X035_9BACT|nr:4Fe-4S dicluster domain-containing protein [Spirosoma montaniterrae]AQG80989.1 FeS-binding protein [Spirosoma montaniterrae]
MQPIQRIGLALFIVGLLAFVGTLTLSQYRLTDAVLTQTVKKEHLDLLRQATADMQGKTYPYSFGFVSDLKARINQLNEGYRQRKEWDKVIGDNYAFSIARAASTGFFPANSGWFFALSVLLGIVGALLYILPNRKKELNRAVPTVRNNGIFKNPATNGGWIGIIVGTFLIGFYVLLYFFPEYLTNWLILFDPLSRALNGQPASQWFVYGTLYTAAILVMGVRMLIKYRHNRYQQLRTVSVMFFQTCFAFLIPELLAFLHQPAIDLKNIWPLDYSFYFDYRIDEKIKAGTFGIFLLVWGTALWLIGVPVLTYFYGKRWYCSWVCGCGGLAETLGDPYRQLSDKRLVAWKIERVVVHSVLVFAVVMTLAVVYTYATGQSSLLGFLDSYSLRSTYGFWIGGLFSGVVGTGFYPLLGNRVWCRFGCPLAAYLGLVQRFKSRFRITTNGGQCISCGNCSAYCEMGIDVRWYAQRGQDIVRSSCVGCGVCSSVCPRGVLNLETADPSSRVLDPMPIILGNDGVHVRGV